MPVYRRILASDRRPARASLVRHQWQPLGGLLCGPADILNALAKAGVDLGENGSIIPGRRGRLVSMDRLMDWKIERPENPCKSIGHGGEGGIRTHGTVLPLWLSARLSPARQHFFAPAPKAAPKASAISSPNSSSMVLSNSSSLGPSMSRSRF